MTKHPPFAALRRGRRMTNDECLMTTPAASREAFRASSFGFPSSFYLPIVSMRVDHALKSWVCAKRIKHWIEPEQRRSNWWISGERASIRFIKDGVQRSDRPITLSGQRCDAGQDLDHHGTKQRALFNRNDTHAPFGQIECSGLIAECRV